MSNSSYAHETLAWLKQRLDDADTMISEAEKTADKLKASARKDADIALTRLKASREALLKLERDLHARTEAVRDDVGDIQEAVEKEWIEAETAFQAFLKAAQDQADSIHDVIVARAKAQRKSWENTQKAMREQVTHTIEKARAELDTAIKRVSDEAEKFQTRIGDAKDAGDESWKAVKAGLADARAAHDRTIQKIKDAFAKLV
jgi:vacuolar-type H+-ATPase subunit I/STV1